MMANISESIPLPCDRYGVFFSLIRNILMYVGYPILILGTIGNLLVILLLLLNKGLRSLPLSIFLMTMSAAGLMAPYVGLLPIIITYQTCLRINLKDLTTEAGCQVVMAASYFSLQLYSWMEACVAVERMFAVRWARTYRTMSTRFNNAVATGVIVIILMAINGIHFKIYGTSYGSCVVVDQELYTTWLYVHRTVHIFFPVAVMLPANVVTIHTMCRSPLKNSSTLKKAKPIAIMMLILNGLFIVTFVPFVPYGVNVPFGKSRKEYEAILVSWVVSRLMRFLGCSLTFLVYVAVAARFRKALSELLIPGKKKIRSALVAMSNNGGNSSGERGDQLAEKAGTTIGCLSNNSTNSTTESKL